MILILGLLLWSIVHLSVAATPQLRAGLIGRLGEGPYKGLFSLLLVGALALIITGWKVFPVAYAYLPPPGLRHAAMLLAALSLLLFFASVVPGDIRRFVRHPQMAAVKLWAVAHLLANGETRSLVLFIGLLAWAVLEVIFINRRDGAWTKPASVGIGKTSLQIVVGLVVAALVVRFAHPWLSGVALLPG